MQHIGERLHDGFDHADAKRDAPVAGEGEGDADRCERCMIEQVTGFRAMGRSPRSRRRRAPPPESEAISPALSAGSGPAPEFD
jgi:hypothetical protein